MPDAIERILLLFSVEETSTPHLFVFNEGFSKRSESGWMRLIKLINSSVIYPTRFWIFPPHLHPIAVQKDDQCLPFSRPSSLINITKLAHFLLEWLMVLLEDSIINLIIAHYQWHNTITKYYNYMKHLRRLCFNKFAFSLAEIGSWLMMSGYLICSRCQN